MVAGSTRGKQVPLKDDRACWKSAGAARRWQGPLENRSAAGRWKGGWIQQVLQEDIRFIGRWMRSLEDSRSLWKIAGVAGRQQDPQEEGRGHC
jgi:hypothetical protein